MTTKTVADDSKGTVIHDKVLGIKTVFASGASGKSVIKRDGKALERGYYAETIDGHCPFGPASKRTDALRDAYDWRAKLVANQNKSRTKPIQSVPKPAAKKKVKA